MEQEALESELVLESFELPGPSVSHTHPRLQKGNEIGFVALGVFGGYSVPFLNGL